MRSRRLRVRRPWAAVIQSSAFVRKELAEIVRQPRLIVLLVLGPFALLLLFGTGYRSEGLGLRTTFVGPEDSFYEEATADYRDVLERFVEPQGFTSDEGSAREKLEDGDLDVVVIFPGNPLQSVLNGERAQIEVLHNKIDPIERTAVAIAAQLAVQEINASVLTGVVAKSQEVLQPADQLIATLSGATDELRQAASEADPRAVTEQARAIAGIADELSRVLGGSDLVLERLGADTDGTPASLLEELSNIVSDAGAMGSGAEAELAARAEELADRVEALADVFPSIVTLDPQVLVRPFDVQAATVVPVRIEATDFYAPSSLALLVQHLAVTFAALSLVRDRELGLFELLRVGPLSSGEIVAGKTIAYMVVGLLVGVGLLAASVHLLGVPLAGRAGWAVAAIALVLLASLSLGLLISLVSGTETQAVQWAMLTLLAGLFFSGFILDLDRLIYPVKILSWLLPVTYGISMLQDVMLRGLDPSLTDLAGVSALTVGYGGAAILLLRHQMRTA